LFQYPDRVYERKNAFVEKRKEKERKERADSIDADKSIDIGTRAINNERCSDF
jgi:hypothetical protein